MTGGLGKTILLTLEIILIYYKLTKYIRIKSSIQQE
jgi:hypothetical protein